MQLYHPQERCLAELCKHDISVHKDKSVVFKKLLVRKIRHDIWPGDNLGKHVIVDTSNYFRPNLNLKDKQFGSIVIIVGMSLHYLCIIL